jgi:hypothetical protein
MPPSSSPVSSAFGDPRAAAHAARAGAAALCSAGSLWLALTIWVLSQAIGGSRLSWPHIWRKRVRASGLRPLARYNITVDDWGRRRTAPDGSFCTRSVHVLHRRRMRQNRHYVLFL